MATAQTNKKLAWWKWILLFIAGIFVGAIEDTLSLAGNEMSLLIGWPILTIATSAIVLMFYALFVKLTNRCWPTDLKLRKLVPHTLLGMLVGAVYMVLVVSTIVAWGHGSVSWSDFSGEAQFSAFMTMLAVAVGEEIFCRGIIFRMIDERWNSTAAFIVTALAFTIAYRGTEPPIVMGLMFAAAYKWSGTLWLPIGFHWAWNYMKHEVIFNDYSVIEPIDSSIVPIEILEPQSLSDRLYYAYISPISENIYAVIYAILFTCIFLFLSYRRSRRRKR